MNEARRGLLTIFSAALDCGSTGERDAYLSEACGGDATLRARIEALLRAHDHAGGFMEREVHGGSRAAGGPTEAAQPARPPEDSVAWGGPTGAPGTVFGPYKLLEHIGEGGMGTVFLAEQSRPVKRVVALKVVKPGIESRHVLARFEAERQALALMEHPNIARVLDAGATEQGRPYFVMELVKGVPITRFCDERKLTPRERLELFIPVCQAVQHAHQKGIIHRDIKPGNVLVALYDGRPVPKVIDFGVAKATAQKLTEATLFTGFGAIVGTLEYMSPEQAEINQVDIDTRSDIYSLGVLLYELLAGSPPFAKRELQDAGVLEMLRVIRDEEPPRPSTKLSTAEGLPGLAADRGTEPAKLTKIVRGELDWIVMKALEKDRARRYDSASGLARDVERFLRDEPVEACPPSASYRLRKLARRHRVPLATAAAFAALLVLGVVVSAWQALRATRAEREARSALADAQTQTAIARAVSAFLEIDVLIQASPEAGLGRDATLRTVLDRASRKVAGRFRDQPLVEASIRHTLGQAYWSLGLYDESRTHLERCRELYLKALGPDHPDSLTAANDLAVIYLDRGEYDKAEPILTRLLDDRGRILGRDHIDTLTTGVNLALLEVGRGRPDRAERTLGRVVALGAPARPGMDPTIRRAMSILATIYRDRGQLGRAEPLLVEALEDARRMFGAEAPAAIAAMNDLGLLYREQAKPEEAGALFAKALEICRRRLGDRHPDTLSSMKNMALIDYDMGRFDRAERLSSEALETSRHTLGERHPTTLTMRNNLAILFRARGRLDRAESLQAEATEASRLAVGEEHPDTLLLMNNLATIYRDRGQLERAEALQSKALATCRRVLGEDHLVTRSASRNLAIIQSRRGQTGRALKLLGELAAVQRRTLGRDHPDVADTLAMLGELLLGQGKPAEAEAPLREAVAIDERSGPDDWRKSSTRSLLGASLARQARRDEAEPLLIAGYEGMKAGEEAIPAPDKSRLAEAGRRIVQLYEEWGKPDRAAEWKARLGPAHPE